jgi:N-acetylmuramoyl-L-alanine amidase
MKKTQVRCFILLFLLFIPLSLFPLTLDETLNTLKTVSPNATLQFRWDPLLGDGVFNLGDHSGAFIAAGHEGENGFLMFDNRELFTVPLPWQNNGDLVFPQQFVAALKDTFTRLAENDAARFRIATIIIDPGHGGRDQGTKGPIPGKKGADFYEKDVVLKVGKALKNLLVQTYPDKHIIMTRETDTTLSLDKRADMANAVMVKDNEAVIFISIHVNWGGNPNARGYEVWHINSDYRRTVIDTSKHNYSKDIMTILNAMLEEEYTTESIILADSILNGFGQILGNSVPSRGRKANDWFVVKNSRMPSVLVELGFVSNPQDAILLTTEDGLQKLTEALYKGIKDYIGIFEHS